MRRPSRWCWSMLKTRARRKGPTPVARASCRMRSRRRPRPAAAAVHHRDRAAARQARIPARRHRRPDRALDDIRQLAAAQRAAHYLPADSRLPIQPGPPGHDQPAKPLAARTQHRVVPAPPPRRPRHPAPRPYPARLDPRLVAAADSIGATAPTTASHPQPRPPNCRGVVGDGHLA